MSLQDASVAAASASIAQDEGASAPARVTAFRILLAQHPPGAAISDAEFQNRYASRNCALGTSTGPANHGDPLPKTAVDQATAAALSVLNDPASPHDVRNAAACVYDTVAGRSGQPFDLKLLRLGYECGTGFVVHNDNRVHVQIAYRVEGTGERGGAGIDPGGDRLIGPRAAKKVAPLLPRPISAGRGR